MAHKERGSIADYALARVLEYLAETRSTGLLEVRSPKGRKSFLIKEGEIALASEGKYRREGLGQLLVAREKLSREDLEKALELQQFRNQRLGEVLLEMGLITQGDIQDCLKFQVEEEICDLFSWEQGVYEFRPDDKLSDDVLRSAITLEINPRALLVESAKRLTEWKQTSSYIPSPLVVYKLTPSGMDLLRSASQSARRVLAMVDEGLPVEEIVRQSYLGRFSVFKAISDLLKSVCIAERTREDLEHLAADNIRKKDYSAARLIYRRLMELAQAPIEVQRTREQLSYLDELEHTESKFLTAVAARMDSEQAATKAQPLERVEETTRTRRKRKVRVWAIALLVVLLVSCGGVIAVFTVPALHEKLFDPGSAEVDSIINSAQNALTQGDYQCALKTYEGFLVRHPTGRSREAILARHKELRRMINKEITSGLEEALRLAAEDEYREALDKIEYLLDAYPTSTVGPRLIDEKLRLTKEWKAFIAKSAAQVAQDKLVQARAEFQKGNLATAATLAQNVLDSEGIPDNLRSEADLLLKDATNLDKVLADMLATALEMQTRGDYESALTAYRQVIRRAPQSPKSHKARGHVQNIEETKERLRGMLDKADSLMTAGDLVAAMKILRTVSEQQGYLEASLAAQRLTPLNDRASRAKDVLEAYNRALEQHDNARVGKLARSLFDEYAQFIDISTVVIPATIHSIPSGASVIVDGKPVGNTPCTVLLSPSRRTPVRLACDGYNTAELVVDDPGKSIYRIYLERTPAARIQVPARIIATELLDANLLAVVTAPQETGEPCGFGLANLSDGTYSRSLALDMDSVQAVVRHEKFLYFLGGGKLVSVNLKKAASKTITYKLPRGLAVEQLYVQLAPLLTNKTVAGIIYENGRALGCAVDDGEIVWDSQPCGAVKASSTAVPGYIILHDDKNLVCVERIGAKESWTQPAQALLAGPAISQMGWYGFVSRQLTVVSGSLATGKTRSQAPMGGIRQIHPPMHLVADRDRLYLAAAEFLYVLNPAEGLVSETALDRVITLDPLVTEKHVYLVGDGGMHRIALDSLRSDWRYVTKGQILSILPLSKRIAVIENLDNAGKITLFDE
ncbi:MAG: DUF4388 domain-containing protein [Planctomycetes bacterium]|nr:DUF4388 domain-containing protein [Planctomycetota bacterium]